MLKYFLAVVVILGLLFIALIMVPGCTFGQNAAGEKTIQTQCTVCKWVWTSAGYKYICPPAKPATPATPRK
jgi:hypothetical protein